MVRRSRAEHGLALPLALAIMLVLSIVIFAVIEFSSSNTRNSSLNEQRQSAKALAEAGVAHGASFLAQQGSSYTTNTGPQIAVIQGVNVTWSATYTTPIWTVSATATEDNPTGPGAADVSRTVEAKFEWTTVPGGGTWKGMYITGQDTVCFMDDGAVVETNVYIKTTGGTGTACLKSGARYLGESFIVEGRLETDTNNPSTPSDIKSTVGQPASKSQLGDPGHPAGYRVPEVRVTRGCGGSAAPFTACTEAKGVYRCLTNTVSPPCYYGHDLSGPSPTVPDPQVAYWLVNAKPGPGTVGTGVGKWPNGCSTSSGPVPTFNSTSDFDLMPASSYNCIVDTNGDGAPEGQLKWDTTTTPPTLTVHGVIYTKGKMLLKQRHGVVSGAGKIYIEGEVDMNDTGGSLCAQTDPVDGPATRPYCDQRSIADGGWDPGAGTNLVEFVALFNHPEAVHIANHFEFQGGLFVVNGGFTLQDEATFKGPLITKKALIKNQALVDAWAPLNIPFSGSGGTTLALKLVRGSWDG